MSESGLSGVRIGLIHTVPALAGVFHASLVSNAPGIDALHIADPMLLDTAIHVGVTGEVYRLVAEHISSLQNSGALGVLVTCSSIGEAVEAAAAKAEIPVMRVDEPMAMEAVAIATQRGRAEGRSGRVLVLATLQATLGPTGRLIERRVEGDEVQVTAAIVTGALTARDSGDQSIHDRLIAEAVTAAADEADVIVLAQASMYSAISEVKVAVPVLTSPNSGIAAFLSRMREPKRPLDD